jgi:GTP-binding protein
VGLPNAGKSTLLSMVTNASPKIASYHFTTLTPNLGVVRNRYGNEFVMADIPGLIEGASQGAGLGHEFLGHVERTKILIHIVDASAAEGGDPLDYIDTVNAELAAYSPELGKKPQIIAANKMDIPEAEEHFTRIKDRWEPLGFIVLPISAAAGTGLQELLAQAWEMVSKAPETTVYQEEFQKADIREAADNLQAPFTVKSPKPGYFVVEGVGVEKMVGYTNLDAEAGMAFFQKYLRDKGIIAELERLGVRDGDTVKIYDMEFDYFR